MAPRDLTHEPIPADFPVQPLKPGEEPENPRDKKTCGHCGQSWDDGKPTGWTPAPSGRCPFEHFHVYPKSERPESRGTRPMELTPESAALELVRASLTAERQAEILACIAWELFFDIDEDERPTWDLDRNFTREEAFGAAQLFRAGFDAID